MNSKGLSSFEKLMYAAYAYFILLGVAFFVLEWYIGGEISIAALVLIAIFGVQARYRNKVGNLILGILALAGCIMGTLEFFSAGLRAGFNGFSVIMTSFSALGIVLAGVLMFSYTKLSFKDM